MIPPNNFNPLIKEIMSRLGIIPEMEASFCNNGKQNSQNNMQNSNNNIKPGITPAQALVISGLLGGSLNIDSVLVDKDQTVQIVLVGSLKEKTQLEKIMDQIGSMPFDDVMKAFLERLS